MHVKGNFASMQEIIEAFCTKVALLARGYNTQAELGEKLGVSGATISRWINRKIDIKNISLSTYLAVMGSLPPIQKVEYQVRGNKDLEEKFAAVREIMESGDQMVIEALTKNLNVFLRDARRWKKPHGKKSRERAA